MNGSHAGKLAAHLSAGSHVRQCGNCGWFERFPHQHRYARPMSAMTWDGGRALGPVALGMTEQEVKAAIPGAGSFFDGRIESTEPLEDAVYSWDSDEGGLSVTFSDGIVVEIAAREEFLLGGENLVGLSADAAIKLAGGEVSRDGEPMEFVTTTSGIVLWVMEGVVAQAR
jgi:hypothetical protein